MAWLRHHDFGSNGPRGQWQVVTMADGDVSLEVVVIANRAKRGQHIWWWGNSSDSSGEDDRQWERCRRGLK